MAPSPSPGVSLPVAAAVVVVMLTTTLKHVEAFYPAPSAMARGLSARSAGRVTTQMSQRPAWAPARPAGAKTSSKTSYSKSYKATRREKNAQAGGAGSVSSGSSSVAAVADPPVQPNPTAAETMVTEKPITSEAPQAAAAAATASGQQEVRAVELESSADQTVSIDTEAAVEEGGKGGDGEGQGEEEEEEVEVELSKEDLLSKRMSEEAEQASTRAARMANLSSDLKRSFAKKQEVEQMIVSEVSMLKQKLKQERDVEYARETELQSLLNEFDETIVEKQDLIEAEQDLLAQMQALREQVTEESIRAPIEAAMAKKADVTSIEVMLLEDLVECKGKLSEELKSTASRAATMDGVVAALPGEDDVARMRAYNWQDVQDLQEVLLSSVEGMEASDAQVASLRAKLLNSVQQKRAVLGQPSSTELVKAGEDAGGALRISPVRAFKTSAELSEEELLQAVAESSKGAAVGVAKTVAAGVSSLGRYAKSPEAQDVAASTVDVFGALKGSLDSIGGAFAAAKEEFQTSTIPGEEITSLDKIFASLSKGFDAVTKSDKVKTELDTVGELLGKQLPEASSRVGKGTIGALKGAASDTDINNPVREALESVEKFIVSMAALGSKYFTNSKAAYFQLPGPVADTSGAKKPASAPASEDNSKTAGEPSPPPSSSSSSSPPSSSS